MKHRKNPSCIGGLSPSQIEDMAGEAAVYAACFGLSPMQKRAAARLLFALKPMLEGIKTDEDSAADLLLSALIEQLGNVLSPVGPATDANVVAWLRERETNAKRIAESKEGDDREGWLEDAGYFHHAAYTIEYYKTRSANAVKPQPPETTEGSANT